MKHLVHLDYITVKTVCQEGDVEKFTHHIRLNVSYETICNEFI